MQALVSKNPAAMMNGVTSVFTFWRRGEALTLRQVRTSAGPSSKSVTIKLVRVEGRHCRCDDQVRSRNSSIPQAVVHAGPLLVDRALGITKLALDRY